MDNHPTFHCLNPPNSSPIANNEKEDGCDFPKTEQITTIKDSKTPNTYPQLINIVSPSGSIETMLLLEEKTSSFNLMTPCLSITLDTGSTSPQSLLELPPEEIINIVNIALKNLITLHPKIQTLLMGAWISWEECLLKAHASNEHESIMPVLLFLSEHWRSDQTKIRFCFKHRNNEIKVKFAALSTQPISQFSSLFPKKLEYIYEKENRILVQGSIKETFESKSKKESLKKEVEAVSQIELNTENQHDPSPTKSALKKNIKELEAENKQVKEENINLETNYTYLKRKYEEAEDQLTGYKIELKKAKLTPRETFQKINNKENQDPSDNFPSIFTDISFR